jgi:hypothetical protein
VVALKRQRNVSCKRARTERGEKKRSEELLGGKGETGGMFSYTSQWYSIVPVNFVVA